MKCLVTGGAGFIGSHLCEKLLEQGHEVVCIDNLITGSEKNVQNFHSNPKFRFLRYDVTQPLPNEFHPELIFHLASPASPNQNNPKSYMANPLETLMVNSLGTYLLVDLAQKFKAKFLYASSSEVYGEPKVHPQKEDYYGNASSIGPRSCYDEGKRFGEAMTMAYFRKYGTDVRIVRIFNTYGPRMADDGRVVVSFILQSLQGQALTVYGDGSQTRSFCYISDLVDGLVKAMGFEKSCGQVFNLGNPQEYQVLDLAQKVRKMTNSNSEISYQPLPEDDPTRRCPDITKARKILTWEPKVPLEEGLQKTIEYFKGEL